MTSNEYSELEKLLESNLEFPQSGKMFLRFETSHNCSVYEDTDHSYLLYSNSISPMTRDEGYDMGWLAAASAMNAIYSMGGKPILASTLLGNREDQSFDYMIQGANEAINSAGCFLAGQQSFENKESFYGLSLVGKVDKAQLKTKSGAQTGDLLILTKPVGAGMALEAHPKGLMTQDEYDQILPFITELNQVGTLMGQEKGVHALNTVGKDGLLNHCVQMAGSSAQIELFGPHIPLYENTLEWTASTFSEESEGMQNLQKVARLVEFPKEMDLLQMSAISNPEPNGGLLIAVSPLELEKVMDNIARVMGREAHVIGQFRHNKSEKKITIRGCV